MKRNLLLAIALGVASTIAAGDAAVATSSIDDGARAAQSSQKKDVARKGGAAAPAGTDAKPSGGVKVSEIKEAGLSALRDESAARGRVLLVNFWATWCTPCRDEFPDLVRLREQFATERLDLVLISLDDVSDIDSTVPEFLASMKATKMPSYLLNADDPDAAINLFDPTWHGELPATFIYDAGGKLVYKHRGRIKPAEVTAAIEGAMKAAATEAATQ